MRRWDYGCPGRVRQRRRKAQLACTFEGPAKFPEKLGSVPKEKKYEFSKNGEPGNKCVVVEGAEKGAQLKVEKAHVEGEGLLSCTVSEGEVGLLAKNVKGTGEIQVEKRERFTFNFRFNAAGVAVAFKITNGHNEAKTQELTATGTANFVKNGEALTKCPKEEVETLNFEAQALAEITP